MGGLIATRIKRWLTILTFWRICRHFIKLGVHELQSDVSVGGHGSRSGVIQGQGKRIRARVCVRLIQATRHTVILNLSPVDLDFIA